MNLEKFLELVFSNPNNVTITYSNVNGKETLNVNGTELTDNFDDSQTRELVAKYKDTIEKIDDCDFLEIVEKVAEHLDVQTFDELVDQESYTEEDAVIVESMIKFMNSVIHEHLSNKIADLQDILENL